MFSYQLTIFFIIVLSSFIGFIPLILAILGTVCFTLMKVFSLQLMVIQLTTIGVASIIGIVIRILSLFIDFRIIKMILSKLYNFIASIIYGIKYLFKLSITKSLGQALTYIICTIFRIFKYTVLNSKKIIIKNFEAIVLKLWDFDKVNILTAFMRVVIIIAIRILMGGILGESFNIEIDPTFEIILIIVQVLYVAYCISVTIYLPLGAPGLPYKMGIFIVIISFIALIFGIVIVDPDYSQLLF